jgi:hypothetical protein
LSYFFFFNYRRRSSTPKNKKPTVALATVGFEIFWSFGLDDSSQVALAGQMPTRHHGATGARFNLDERYVHLIE